MQEAHTAVAAVVSSALGGNGEAWSRFASTQASYGWAQPRLCVLGAALQGIAWQNPPNAKSAPHATRTCSCNASLSQRHRLAHRSLGEIWAMIFSQRPTEPPQDHPTPSS
jgi:hypothetical protein